MHPGSSLLFSSQAMFHSENIHVSDPVGLEASGNSLPAHYLTCTWESVCPKISVSTSFLADKLTVVLYVFLHTYYNRPLIFAVPRIPTLLRSPESGVWTPCEYESPATLQWPCHSRSAEWSRMEGAREAAHSITAGDNPSAGRDQASH